MQSLPSKFWIIRQLTFSRSERTVFTITHISCFYKRHFETHEDNGEVYLRRKQGDQRYLLNEKYVRNTTGDIFKIRTCIFCNQHISPVSTKEILKDTKTTVKWAWKEYKEMKVNSIYWSKNIIQTQLFLSGFNQLHKEAKICSVYHMM